MRRIKRLQELQESKSENKTEKRGGQRGNSGRKRIGETKKVSISLPYGDWERFDEFRGNRTRSEVLRDLILKEIDSPSNER